MQLSALGPIDTRELKRILDGEGLVVCATHVGYDRMRDDLTYESFSHRHHSYLHRGHYAEQLERGFRFFPRSQWHIIDSKAYFDQPGTEYRSLLTFLGLDAFDSPNFGQHNARPSKPMPSQTLRALRDHYAPHDKRLAGLLRRSFSWINQESDT